MYCIFIIHSPVDSYLGCFQSLAIVTSATMCVDEQSSVMSPGLERELGNNEHRFLQKTLLLLHPCQHLLSFAFWSWPFCLGQDETKHFKFVFSWWLRMLNIFKEFLSHLHFIVWELSVYPIFRLSYLSSWWLAFLFEYSKTWPSIRGIVGEYFFPFCRLSLYLNEGNVCYTDAV
jgi:hypothetical protein